MSEQTYTRIVQIVVILLFVLGLIYAGPFAPASAQAGAGDTVLVKRHDHDARRNAHQDT